MNRSHIAADTCEHCQTVVVIARGGVDRCVCRRLELHWGAHGGLGPITTHYPERNR